MQARFAQFGCSRRCARTMRTQGDASVQSIRGNHKIAEVAAIVAVGNDIDLVALEHRAVQAKPLFDARLREARAARVACEYDAARRADAFDRFCIDRHKSQVFRLQFDGYCGLNSAQLANSALGFRQPHVCVAAKVFPEGLRRCIERRQRIGGQRQAHGLQIAL